MAKIEILFPQMGESIVEGTITKWLKKPGDQIAKDETILEISTDKVDSEVPSSHEGILEKILFNEGDRAQVGQAIAVLETDAASASVEDSAPAPAAPTPSASSAAPAPVQGAPVVANGGSSVSKGNSGNRSGFYSPLVRKIASENNLTDGHLAQIQGSGESGRVTKKDLLSFLDSGGASEAPVSNGAAAPAAPSTGGASSFHPFAKGVSQLSKTMEAEGKATIEPMDSMRKVIAERMWESVQISPHVTSFQEVDVTNLVNYRKKQKPAFVKKYGFNLTFTTLIADATVRALTEFPYMNASVEGPNVVLKNEINLGMAVSVDPMGLMVPVVKNADEKNLLGLAKNLNDLIHRTRAKQVKADELAGATFSITNLGTFGSLTGTPIINQPNVGILGLGAITKKPVVVETAEGDFIAIRSMMVLSLAYDHRLVDGGLGGKFLGRVAELLANYEGPDFTS